MFKTKKITFALAGVFLCAICVGLSMLDVSAGNAGTVRRGVYVEALDISGMTQKEAKEAIKQYVANIKDTTVSIKINDKMVDITLGELGYKWKNTKLAQEAISLGKRGNVVKRYIDECDIDNNGKKFELEMSLDKKDVEKALKAMCDSYNIEAKNASLKLTSSGFEITDEQAGVVVEYKKTAEAICDYVVNAWDEKSEISIVASTIIDKPKYTREDCELVSSTPMSTYSTNFSVNTTTANRNKNIENGARLLDAHVIYPEEEFSVNRHLEPWTEENGYYPAGTYVDGAVEDSLGGGICQVSSTLYNALLLAELEIVERYPHSMSVGYVPLAADAALAGTYKDLVFKNNTDAPIYVQAIYNSGTITFNIYGHDTRETGRTVRYVSETISTTQVKEEVTKDKTKPTDYKETISEGHVGYVAKLWKYVYEGDKEISKELVNTSTYRMTPRKVVVGTKKKEEQTEKGTKKGKKTEKETPSNAQDETTKKASGNNSAE